MRAAPRGLLSFVRREAFGSTPDAAFSVVTILGALGGFIGATDVLRWFLKWSESEFGTYLYVSYSGMCVLFVGWVVVYRKVTHKFVELQDRSLIEMQILRRLGETAKHFASPLEERGNQNPPLLPVETFQNYLRAKFDAAEETAVTVKFITSAAQEGKMVHVLKVEARLGRDKRNGRRDVMSLPESLVYQRFVQEESPFVYIEDTEALSTDVKLGKDEAVLNDQYSKYAEKCGFRSVLAFPIRQPATNDAGEIVGNKLLGFFCMDRPEPDGFRRLFSGFGGKHKESKGARPKSEIEFFYALANGLAIIRMLMARDQAAVEEVRRTDPKARKSG